MGRESAVAQSMVSTIKVGMGCAKSTYLRNHTFKSPVTRTDTRSLPILVVSPRVAPWVCVMLESNNGEWLFLGFSYDF